jgi:uncharacterized protein (TIGR02217 family)
MPVPVFIEAPRLELPRGWVYEVSAEYDTSITKRGRRRESRNLFVDEARIRIGVTIPRDRVSDIPYLLRFFRVMRARTAGFRVQDPTDYLSTEQGFVVDEVDVQPAATDQPLIEVDGSSGTQFELWKQYKIGEGPTLLIYERRIAKPVADAIAVANEVGAEQDAATWTLDTSTGIITVGLGFDGVPNTWGGQFDIPARFDSELPLRVEDFRLDEASFSILELPRA